ncbi:MAG: hypothetical protein DMF61_19670 [Blastocatellia bacterium AA13]|nr:MAG: hypothetical protein DMF61_19670 [Blastocatellia bacterium AA13]
MAISSLKSALLVESDPAQAAAIKSYLLKSDFTVDHIGDHARAFEVVSAGNYDVAIVELLGGRACDLELIQYISRKLIRTATIATTWGEASKLGAVALEMGARTFLIKPFAPDDLAHYVKRAIEDNRHAEEAFRLTRLREQERQERKIVGSSVIMRSIMELVASLADAPDTTVLIKGESGTGKDLVANAIHDATVGERGPFTAINCAALPNELIESELFGYEKGAFTGASQTKRGTIELSDGGTLYLDEIAEMPMSLQAKLLRFLDEKSFRRVGGSTVLKVSLRVIAATNRNIEEMVQRGAFRRDLYFRLSGFPISLPPLRDRGADVLDVTRHLIERFTRRHGKQICGITPQLEKLFLSYDWPGNVRELKNLIERAVIISNDVWLDTRHVRFDGGPDGIHESSRGDGLLDISLPLGRSYLKEVAFYEKELVERAIREAGGVKTTAAKLLGISRHAFDRVLKRVDRLTGEKPLPDCADSAHWAALVTRVPD